MARSSTSFQPGNSAGAKPGNKLALRHGATVPEIVQPKADLIKEALVAELANLPYMEPVDGEVANTYSFLSAQLRQLEAYFAKNGGGLLTSRGQVRKSGDLYLKIAHRQQEMAKVLGIGPVPRAQMMQAAAGARKDVTEVRMAQERLRAKQAQQQPAA